MNENLLKIAGFLPSSLEEPAAWVGHVPFAAWMIERVAPKIFVELGTHTGNSYFSFCQAVQNSGISTNCFAVDTWEGDEHAGKYGNEIYEKVNSHNVSNYEKFSRLMRMKFDDAIAKFSDGSIGLLHIDGLHTYEAVKHDFESWLPKMAQGGFILFHDTNVREHGFGVWRLWEELALIYPNNIEFKHSFGLGVIQIDHGIHDKNKFSVNSILFDKNELVEYFSALGERVLNNYRLNIMKKDNEHLHFILAQRDSQVQELQQVVAQRDSQVQELQQVVAQRDSQVQELQQVVAQRDSQVQEIFSSTSWKVTFPLRWLKTLALINKNRIWIISKYIYRKIPLNIEKKNKIKSFLFRNYPKYFKQTASYKIWKDVGDAAVNIDFTVPAENFIEYFPSGKTNFNYEVCNPLSDTVDIILPVYGGYIATKRCIESVLRSFDLIQNKFRLIIINDLSPEPELVNYLKNLHSSIKVIHNKVNLGFTATVNKGMKLSEVNDVILLNSDTEVANNWLDKLRAHAYQDERNGTITPFSNNATICSYPNIEGSKFNPFLCITSDLDRAFNEANLGKNIQIPTAVGFCMYIRRDCLDQVGYFDVEAFGKGYGEENDFCMRASKLGWNHLLAGDTYVFHEGEASFSKESDSRKERAGKIILEKYPYYDYLIQKFIQGKASAPLHVAATAAIVKMLKRKAVLHIEHADGGGTSNQINDLIAQMPLEVVNIVLKPVPSTGRVKVKIIVREIERVYEVLFPLDDPDILTTFFESFGVGLVHVHHLLGYSIDIPLLLYKINRPYYVTIHDYLSICPKIHLFNEDLGGYCNEPDENSCNQCLKKGQSLSSDISSWRMENGEFLSNAQAIICPSLDVKMRMKRYYKDLNYIVIPHDERYRYSRIKVHEFDVTRGQIRIGIIGAIGPHKGSKFLKDLLVEIEKKDYQIIIDLIGYTDIDLSKYAIKGIFKQTGPYAKGDLKRLVTQSSPDIILFLPGCPETYSFTLSEALLTNKPLLLPDIGAYIERRADDSSVNHYDHNSSPGDLLRKILDNKIDSYNLNFDFNENSVEKEFYIKNYFENYGYSVKNKEINLESNIKLNIIKNNLKILEKTEEKNKFYSEFYLKLYPDIRKSGIDPYQHYINHGKSEGRHPRLDDDIQVGKANALNLFAVKPINTIDSVLAVHLHLYYIDLADEFKRYIDKIPFLYDLYISVPIGVDKTRIYESFKNLGYLNELIIEEVQNIGRDVAPMLTQFGLRLRKYKYLCHLHSKKSEYDSDMNGWREYLCNSLLGDSESINKIISTFENNLKCNLIYPENYIYLEPRKYSWSENKYMGKKILKKLKIQAPVSEYFDYPAGNMFWVRIESILPLLNIFNIYEFGPEDGKTDGTMAHALERVIAIVANDSNGEIKYIKDQSPERVWRGEFFKYWNT
jgi:GT2 family glycosyltransferase